MDILPVREKQGYQRLPLLYNMVMELLVTVIKQEQERKSIRLREEKMKLFLFTNDMILYTENPKQPTRKTIIRTSKWMWQ